MKARKEKDGRRRGKKSVHPEVSKGECGTMAQDRHQGERPVALGTKQRRHDA